MRMALLTILATMALLLASCTTVPAGDETPAQQLERNDTYIPWWWRN